MGVLAEPGLSGETAQKPEKLLHLEFIRILAIFLVLFNHTGADGFFLFSVSQGSRFYWLYLVLSIADKIAVPLFFMTSGALLLGKDETMGELYGKRIARFAIVVVGISVVYLLYHAWLNQEPLTLRGSLITIYSSCASWQLWFLYNYLGILVMLPLIRRLARAMDARDYVYLALVYISVVGVLPVLEYLVTADDSIAVNDYFYRPIAITPGVFFLLMGYFLERVLDCRFYTRRNALLALAVGAAAIIVSALMTHYRAQVTGECCEATSQRFHENLSALPAMAVYFACKYIFDRLRPGQRLRRLICFFGGTSFGLYLIERLVRDSTLPVFRYLRERLPVLPAALIWIGCACLVGSFITALVKKLPGMRRLL